MDSKKAKLTQRTLSEIYHRINQKKYEKRFGSFCMFIPLNKKVGVKLYLRKDNRNFAWKHQRNLSNKELAPHAGNCFEIESGTIMGHYSIYYSPRILYGFFTEIAEKVTSRTIRDTELNTLKEDLTDHKYSITDVVPRNLGRLNRLDGKLVLIDTDMISLRK